MTDLDIVLAFMALVVLILSALIWSSRHAFHELRARNARERAREEAALEEGGLCPCCGQAWPSATPQARP